ncbi:MAG: hypothetical protein H5T97_13650 [Firmicutes bacterium]|nr:hypothetical protein [Bacillota bacterium]
MGRVVSLHRQRPAAWQEALREFLLWKQAAGASPRTLEDYRERVGQFYRQHPEAWHPDKVKAAAYGRGVR